MWMMIFSTTLIITFVISMTFGQHRFFHLVRDNSAIDGEVSQIINETSYSQTSCFLNCLNHEQCCFIQIKESADKWMCSFFSLRVDLGESKPAAGSNIFSAAEKENCNMRECQDWYRAGFIMDGIYNIVVNQKSVKVLCDMTNEGGGWTIIQRRVDGSVDFQRTWDEYTKGFGDIGGDYWLGNDLIYQMTNSTSNTLVRIKATSFEGVTKYIIFKGFSIEDEPNKYKLHTGKFESGEASLSDDWLYHNEMLFTTRDKDNDPYSGNCAVDFSGGWWYGKCYDINPNNLFSVVEDVAFGKGMTWQSWKEHQKSLKTFSISLKDL